jgi:UDP-N-acetylglucosamine acyltransferase
MIDIGRLVRQIPSQYPFVLVDRILEHDGSGLVGVKSVTGSEEFFEGHFPGAPVMPGVLIMECLAQAAGIWLLNGAPDPRRTEVYVVGIDEAKFRRPVVPGDTLELEVRVIRRRSDLWLLRGEVRCGDQRVAEARILLKTVVLPEPEVHETARIAPGAVLAAGTRVGPYSVVGPQVRIGTGTVLESHVVIGGDTELGAGNHVFPFASIGLAPQDKKYRGERTRLVLGDRNVIREYVTLQPGTEGGGGLTRIGSDNLFMATCHVAHDCTVGSHTVFANGTALGGHVEVQDFAWFGAFCGVHQFCRVGVHAFLGGSTIATQDVLPYSKTVGNRACIYGPNTVGLQRRGFSPEAIAGIRHAFHVLLQSHLTTSAAIEKLERDGSLTPEARRIVDFVRSSKRGVILKRRTRHASHDETE